MKKHERVNRCPPAHYFVAVLLILVSAFSSHLAFAQVGMTQIAGPDLPITIVYPTATVGSPHEFGPFDLDVALDAKPARGNGRLIVFSHGSGGDAFSLHTLARTLALAGFVVVQPLHRGDNFKDHSDSGIVSWTRRPVEISRAIDVVAADARFTAVVHFDSVGVYGMSAGGGTALALAGGDWSVATLMHHCAAHIDDDAGFCLYGVRSAAEGRARAQSYFEPIPKHGSELLAGELVRDKRIKVIAVSVPIGAIFTPRSLAAIRTPVGIVAAEADQVLNPRYHSGDVLAHCSACRLLDSVPGGGHYDTLSPWPDVIAEAAAKAPGAKRNPTIDDARRQVSYDRIAAFFGEQLRPR